MPHARGARSVQLHPAIRPLAWIAVAGTVGGCSTAAPTPTPRPATACRIGAPGAGAGDTLSIATLGPIEAAHAPVPTDAAERLVIAQLYEPLLAIDCEGNAQPALARSWNVDATGARVTLTLRVGARWWDGTPVVAEDVLAAWRATAARGDAAAALARRVADGATVVDEHTLTLSLPEADLPILADPALAVYRPASDSPWPAGSGRYQVVRQDGRGQLVLAPVASRADPLLVIRPVADPRDAIDAGVDVLVTEDPIAVSYARARGGLDAVPLPWTTTYALASPPRGPGGSASLPGDVDLASFGAALARDAVHAEARAAEPPFWWIGASGCEPPTLLGEVPSRGSNRIVYRRADAVARGIAERLVALGRGAAAAGLAPDDFARALHEGGDLAYVLDLPRAPLAWCQRFSALRSAAPWLSTERGGPARLVPLVDTRQRAIVNRGRVSATILSDGTLLFGAREP